MKKRMEDVLQESVEGHASNPKLKIRQLITKTLPFLKKKLCNSRIVGTCKMTHYS